MRIGLALGGGVVRGWAHLGVLEVLQSAGVQIDLAAGTSAGSIVAVGLCSGRAPQELLAFARRFSWLHLVRPVWPRRGIVSFDGLRQMMDREFGPIDLADLPTPCAVAVTDIERGEPVYLTTGPASLAVQASCSVPGTIAPVQIDGRWMCEGGVTDMLPATVLRRMGADYIIGVDIFTYKLRRMLGPLGYLLAGLEIALERTGGGPDLVDLLIRPDLAGKSYVRFSQRDELIELGRQAARRCVPKLLADLEALAAGASVDRLEPEACAIRERPTNGQAGEPEAGSPAPVRM